MRDNMPEDHVPAPSILAVCRQEIRSRQPRSALFASGCFTIEQKGLLLGFNCNLKDFAVEEIINEVMNTFNETIRPVISKDCGNMCRYEITVRKKSCEDWVKICEGVKKKIGELSDKLAEVSYPYDTTCSSTFQSKKQLGNLVFSSLRLMVDEAPPVLSSPQLAEATS